MVDRIINEPQVRMQESSLFQNWSPYEASKIIPQLPSSIRYTPPKPNEGLRRRIRPIENKLNDDQKFCLRPCLSFLEGGTMEDNFGRDDVEREKYLTYPTIMIDEEVITLHQLARRINKLSGSAILKIIATGPMTYDQDLTKKSFELMKKFHTVKKERGFFIVSDLEQFDDLALSIVEYILKQ